MTVAVPPAEMEDPGCGIPSSCIVSLQRRHDSSKHLLVLEGGGFTYLSVPPSKSVDEGKLCFLDHRLESWDSVSEMCCLREAGHVHAHVHHGDITEDILLEQCMDEAGCTLPMPWDMGSMRTPICSGDERDSDHEHQEGCGHNRIAHGDHFDWLIPQDDGSYVLKHAQATANGVSQFIEHGRLVKVGESLGQLKRRPRQLVNLFSYESPIRKGYESLPKTEEMLDTEIVAFVKSPSIGCLALSSPKQAAVVQEDVVKLTIPRGFKSQGMIKTTFDVMGICCPSEVPLVKKILAPLPGVEEVLVNPTSKTVTVLHDPTVVADVQLVKILNEARLDASIHQRGKRRIGHKWPSPWTIGSGLLLLISFLHYAWSPLKWVALGSIAVGVPPILVRSLVALRRCVLDINALMIIAVGGAIALGDYVEAGSICFLFTLADWLESRSSDKAREAISNVGELAPQTAVLMDGQRVGVEDVKVGTLLAVKAGELIPIDGEVVSGKSSIDESTVTGESKPVEKAMGALVWAGTMNLSGYISVKTTALAEDSAVSRMVRLVEEAQNQHSRTEQLVEKVAKYYTPLVVLAALLIAVIPLAAGSHHHRHWIYLALVLLVVACPCALVISTPVTTTCGIAQAARSGLLVRGGGYLEALARVNVLAVDKTGTLTEGHFRVLDVQPFDSTTSVQQILYWIACVESKSSHPLAPALVAYARLHGVEPTGDISDFEIIPGLGVSAVVDGYKVQIGNARLAASFVRFEDSNSEIVNTWSNLGATVGWVGVNDRPVGVFGVADSVRPEAIEAVASLKKLGMRVVMLTGDSAAAASIVHSQIGDIEVHSELLPEDKVKLVKELKGTGVTAMVGDGINDAPALALADIGIAMGVAGSAVAMETADVALMTNDLRKLAVAIKLGRNVRFKIIQNVSLSFLTKLTIIILAAVGYPSLWAAVLADVGTCLVVIFNSMRLLNRKKGVVLPKFESKKGHKRGHQNHVHGQHQQKHGNLDHFQDDHQELDSTDYHQHHHQELGKIRDNHHHHHHHEELDNCGDGHPRLCDNLNKTGDHCHQELGKTCEHDHYLHKMHHHGVKIPCWPSHRHGHSKAAGDQVVDVILDQTPTSQLHPVKGWAKITSLSGTTAKSRKSCTKDSFGSNCCSETSINVDNKCCQSSNKDTKFRSKITQVFRSAPDGTPSVKCCTIPGTGIECSVGNSICATGTGTDEESKSCSKLFVKPRATTQGTALGKQCCVGQDKSKNLNTDKKLKMASGSHCCSGQQLKPNCCSDVRSKAASGSKCCSGQDEEKICCSKSDTKLEAGHGNQFCSGQVDKDRRCCSNSEKKQQEALGQGCSVLDPETKSFSSGAEKVKAPSGSQHCSGHNLEKKGCSKLEESLKAASGSLCCPGEDTEQSCSSHDAAIPPGKAAATETIRSCGRSKCQSTDHSKCSTEALVHGPLIDLSSFTRPVSPL
ncbi:unnamed protein product [Calypogeia fissa]